MTGTVGMAAAAGVGTAVDYQPDGAPQPATAALMEPTTFIGSFLLAVSPAVLGGPPGVARCPARR